MNTERTTLQERLAAAIAAATPDVDVEAVLDRVEQRRDERRRAAVRQRRSRRVLASGVLAAACVAAVVVLTTRSTQELRTVDAADPTPAPSVTSGRVDRDGAPAPTADEPQPVELPGVGARASAVATATDGFWVTRGEALDGDRVGPDTVTWIGHDGTVGPSTEVRGVALSGVGDDVHLWFLVREANDLTAPGALRLKQVERSSGTLLASHDVPLGEPPAGIGLDGANLRVHGRTRDVVLDRGGAVLDDRAAPRPFAGPTLPVADSELADLAPSDALVSADAEHLWVLRGTTVRPLPRER